MSDARLRLLTVSDSESYLKWSVAWLDRLGANQSGSGVIGETWLMDNPILPTSEQIASAISGTSLAGRAVPVVPRRELRERIAGYAPDIVLAGATGPVVQQIFASAASIDPRPGLASGLPGMGLPATAKGMRYRKLGDMFLSHSLHEQREYTRAAQRAGAPCEVVVSRLPMLESDGIPAPDRAPVARIVFAPQAKVPYGRQDRMDILLALAGAAESGLEVVIKVRALGGEQQTHREEYPYDLLLAEAEDSGRIARGLLKIGTGALANFLESGTALTTVSSTAALEALDRGLQIHMIGDFGVNEEMLNEAYEDSGTVGSLEDLAAGRFAFPNRGWLEGHYFHSDSGQLREALDLLSLRARERQLPDLGSQVRLQDLRRLRAEVRSLTPAPLVSVYRRGRVKLERLWHG